MNFIMQIDEQVLLLFEGAAFRKSKLSLLSLAQCYISVTLLWLGRKSELSLLSLAHCYIRAIRVR